MTVYLDNWTIEHNPKPIPTQMFDWDFVHDDYDGPEDTRCGAAMSPEACLYCIREIEEELSQCQ